MANYDDKKPNCPPADLQPCQVTGHSTAQVSVPVKVSPYAKVGKISSKCCGEPKITFGCEPPKGKKDNTCCYTISQNICVEIPIEFGAKVETGETFIDCLSANLDDECHK